jgi:hypothetical protein
MTVSRAAEIFQVNGDSINNAEVIERSIITINVV